MLYSHPINLDKQDGAFDIYSGRRSENHLPRRLRYLPIIYLLARALSPHFWGASYCSLSAFIECIFFYWSIFKYEFSQQLAKLKPVLRKHTHTPSLFSLGKVQNCKRHKKCCTCVWEGIHKNEFFLVLIFSSSVEATNTVISSLVKVDAVSHSSTSLRREYGQPDTAQISTHFCGEFTG